MTPIGEPLTEGTVLSQRFTVEGVVVPVGDDLLTGLRFVFQHAQAPGDTRPVDRTVCVVVLEDVDLERAGQRFKKVIETAIRRTRQARRSHLIPTATEGTHDNS